MSDAKNEGPGFALRELSGSAGLSFAGSRALIYGQAAADMLRRQLISTVGEDLARSVVAQAGREAGLNDAQRLKSARGQDSMGARLELQYELLAASGFGHFEVRALHLELDAGQAYVHVRCVGSPEAESRLRLFGPSERGACWHLVGYSTGWITAMTGVSLLTVESRCVAKGDAHCEFETLPYEDFVGPEARFWKRVLESTSTSMTQELAAKLASERATVREQEVSIEQLSAPLLQVTGELLVLPVIGSVDRDRVELMSAKLLHCIAERSVRGVILDVTGMELGALGVESVAHLLSMARAARMLGARIVMTGISPELAGMLSTGAVDIGALEPCRTLRDGVRYLEAKLRRDG